MPRSEGAVLITTGQSERPRVKPEPPSDLWDQLAALNDKAGIPERSERPVDAFTTTQYAEKFGLSISCALRRINKLVKTGELQKHGTIGVNVSYTVVKK